MGYNSTAEGVITIVPALSHREIKAHKEFFNRDNPMEAIPVVEKTVSETDDGTLVTYYCDHIEPYGSGESYKRYHLEDHLKEFVAAYPDHEYSGRIVCHGEDGEMWAYIIKDNKVKTIKPKIVWEE